MSSRRRKKITRFVPLAQRIYLMHPTENLKLTLRRGSLAAFLITLGYIEVEPATPDLNTTHLPTEEERLNDELERH